MAGKREKRDESSATLHELMSQPSPSPAARAEILTRRRQVRESLQEHRDRKEWQLLGID